jgi:hypothetical protein
MDNRPNDILQLRFEGNGINPDKVKPSEICDLIIELQNALNATIKQQHPEIDTDEVLFSLEGIRDKSLAINLKALAESILPEIKNTVVSCYLTIAFSVKDNDLTNLHPAAVQAVKKVSAFSKKYECNGQFNHNEETVSTITPLTELKEKKPYIVKSTIRIYGEVVDVGSNVHIKLNDGTTLYVVTTKENSKRLGASLWDVVGLVGVAKWDSETLKIHEFRLTEILDYNPKTFMSIITKIRQTESGWDKFNSNDDINKQLLRD